MTVVGADTDLAYRARLQADESEAREYELLTITHPSWATPIHLVNAPEPGFTITSLGRVFRAAGFAAEWPDLDADGRRDTAGALALALVVPDDPAIKTLLVAAREAVIAGFDQPELTLELVENLNPDIIRASTPPLPLVELAWDANAGIAQATLGLPKFLMRRVGRRYVPAVFPALATALR